MRSVRDNLNTQFIGMHCVESGGVERVFSNSQTACIRDRDKVASVPVKNPVGRGRSHTAVIHPPIDADLVSGDWLAPVILHPLRIDLRPIAVGATLTILGVSRSLTIVQR